jgi:Transposase DDE domain
MSTRCQVLHAWTRQVQRLLPTVHATRAATLAAFALGILWSGTVTLLHVAAALPLPASDASSERRWRRFLANDRVSLESLWQPLVPALLAGVGQRDVLFVFDPTPYRDCATLLCLGLVCRGRVLPVAWRVVPQQQAWPERLEAILDEVLAEVNAALPGGVTATLLADRGLVGPAVIEAAQRVGWHVVLRLRASAGEATVVRVGTGPEQRLATLPTGPGQRWDSPVAIFKAAGWRDGFLTIRWDPAAAEPWVLFSDRPGGAARVREYRRRATAEATYQDAKGRGFGLERSKVVALDRIARLLLVVHLALWWAFGLGLQTIRNGQRHRYDRRGRRDLSLVRLGHTACLDALHHDRAPMLPFRLTPTGWAFPWLR